MIHKAESGNWVRLTDMREENIPYSGSIFRFPSQYPYEEYVDYMLSKSGNPCFIVISGYKGGFIFGKLCDEIDSDNLNFEWFVKNWKTHVYPDCEPEDVYYCNGLPVPDYPIHLALRSMLKSGSEEEVYE